VTPPRCRRCGDLGYVYLGVATIPCPTCRPRFVTYTYEPVTSATTGPSVTDRKPYP
jgi:hypothetical protein